MRAVRPFPLALAAIMVGALVLRLWGHRVGLPYVYNVDEGAHFVPRAIGMFDHSYDPGYFINPPGLTYVLHVAFWLRWGGDGTRELFATDPGAVYGFARVIVTVLSTLSVGALAWAALRLFDDRRIALVAAALLAVAFLPVHYGHFALNDAVVVLPVCVALAGAAGVWRTGRTRDYLTAGAGVGAAAAVKYTGGIALVPLVAAAAMAPRRAAAGAGAAPRGEGQTLTRAGAIRGLGAAGACALVAFLVLNPYALLSFDDFRAGLQEQSSAAAGGGKLGLEQTHGVRYYLETTLWGLGVVPVLAGFAGGALLAWRERRLAWLLLPAPVLFVLFMGLQDRYFARWLLPVYPLLILLASYGALQATSRLRRWAPALAAVALGAQGLVYAIHNDVVMTRPDTRADLRAWMLDNVPAGSRIVLEPIAPDAWADPWVKRPTSHFLIRPDGTKFLKRRPKLEDYPRTLRPDLLDAYVRAGDCHVITGSIIAGRPAVTPDRAPHAVDYYAALRERGELEYAVAPGDIGGFSFDDSYNWRPLAYHRPGPAVAVYRLTNCP